MSEETAPTMTARERRNAKARETFIEVLRQSCNVTAACRASKIPRGGMRECASRSRREQGRGRRTGRTPVQAAGGSTASRRQIGR